MAIHQFSGRVVDQATQSGKPGLRVEARDASERYADVIAAAVTDERGDFALRVDDRELTKLFGKVAPELFLKVLELKNPPTTPHAIWANTATYLRWMAGRNGEGRIEVPGSAIGTTSVDPVQIVEGIVGIRGTSTLGAGLTVEVRETRLTKPTGLAHLPRGTTTTGDDGSYRISYDVTENASTTPDLEVRVTSGGSLLASASVRAAAPRVTVDVVVLGEPGRPHPGVPLFATTQNRILRLAAEAGSSANLAIKDISEDSYAYVACRARVPVEHVAALVQAEQLADLYSSTTNLRAETFFALLTSGIERAALFDHKLDGVRAILTDAARTGRVSPGVEDGLTAIMADYLIAAKSELSMDGANGTREFTPIGQLAMLTPGFTTTQRDLVIEYHLTADDPERFWELLDGDSHFDNDDIASLKFGIEVAPLVQSWPEMLGKLQSNRAGGTPDNVLGRDLAAKDTAYWNALILITGFPPSTPGGSADAKRANYRDAIMNAVEQRYRTAFLGFRQTGAVQDFFDANPDLDFESMRLERYLIEEDLLGELSGDTLTKLRGLERLFHLTSSYSEIEAIVQGFEGKVTSAYQLHQVGASGLHAAAPSLSAAALDRIMTKVSVCVNELSAPNA